jgi:hypothetical protein
MNCATPAQWVIHLRVAANFFQDPPLPWVRFFGCLLHPMAGCWFPCCFFRALKVFTAASSLGISSGTSTNYISHEVGSLLSRQASPAAWQAIVSFCQDVIFCKMVLTVAFVFTFISPWLPWMQETKEAIWAFIYSFVFS